ncbi:MAG: hypothetical protein OXC95_06410, partial [Dehalococcoidia bacterium]|nr:hypothetical protein [Dehalococcoidia bacterium]
MTSMALRGTIIILAAVALIGAVVALRVAQAQQPARTYTISVTPDKVLEGGDPVNITVEVTVSRAFTQAEIAQNPNVNRPRLYIANDEDSSGCDIIPSNQCRNEAIRGSDRDFTGSDPGEVTLAVGNNTIVTSLRTTLNQDAMIEGDEKIYLALCPENDRNNCDTSNLLATASITIVGEQVWTDNSDKIDTTTVELKEDQPVAGAFTTGADSDGYRMNNVKLQFGGSLEVNTSTPADVTVGLHEDSNGQPQRRIGELCGLTESGPEDCTSSPLGNPAVGNEAIYTNSEGILLEPNTKYWVVVTGTQGLLETTSDHRE